MVAAVEPRVGVQLRTSRLLLSPISDADVAALVRHWGDAAVARYLWLDQPVTAEGVATVVTTSNGDFRRSGHGVWAVHAPEGGALIGMCGLRQVEGQDWLEILFSLRQRYWGQGLGTEAVFAVLEYAFQRLGLNQIVAVVDPKNLPLVRLLSRAGFAFFTARAGRTYWDVTRTRFLASSKRPPAPTESG